MRRNLALPIVLLCLGAAAGALTAEEAAEDGFRVLFNGENLDGWVTRGGDPVERGWVVEDGTIHRASGGGDIYTEGRWRDFDLRFEWKVAEGANSGVKYRVADYGGSYLGPEYQILDDERHPNGSREQTSAAAMYDLLGCNDRKKLKPVGQWNSGRIVCDGHRIEHWVNGEKVLEVDTSTQRWEQAKADSKFSDLSGFGEPREGRVMLQDHGDRVWYRNIRIRPLDDSE